MSASKVRVDKAEGALPQCKTFAWLAAPADATSLTEQRVRTEVMQALQAKGYTETADKPDCRITYHFSVSDQQKKSGPSIGVGAGGGSGGIGGGIGISLPIGRKKTQSGTFTLDVVDAARSAQVWSGSIDTKSESQELTEKEAKDVVQKILANYPDRAPAN
jgi:hypothetical protein